MKLNPLVSICIPTHNQNPIFLKKCVESVIQQTYKNIEIIINNNNTTNESLSYIKSLSEETEKIIKIFTNESTVCLRESFEQAIHNATGDYLFILPSDDFIEKNAIEVLVDTLCQHPDADSICGQFRYVDKEFNQVQIKKHQLYYENKERQIYDSLRNKNNYLAFSLLRAEFIKNTDIFLNKKIKYTFDGVFTNEVTLHGKVVVIDDIIANMQIYNPSRNGRYADIIIEHCESLYHAISAIFEDKNLQNKISKIIIAKIVFIHIKQAIRTLAILSLKLEITAKQLINTLTYVVKSSFSIMILLIKL